MPNVELVPTADLYLCLNGYNLFGITRFVQSYSSSAARIHTYITNCSEKEVNLSNEFNQPIGENSNFHLVTTKGTINCKVGAMYWMSNSYTVNVDFYNVKVEPNNTVLNKLTYAVFTIHNTSNTGSNVTISSCSITGFRMTNGESESGNNGKARVFHVYNANTKLYNTTFKDIVSTNQYAPFYLQGTTATFEIEDTVFDTVSGVRFGLFNSSGAKLIVLKM